MEQYKMFIATLYKFKLYCCCKSIIEYELDLDETIMIEDVHGVNYKEQTVEQTANPSIQMERMQTPETEDTLDD